MRTEAIRELEAIAASGSLNAAAKQLFMTRPALTAHIDALEAELGFAVIDREGFSRLTKEGAIFLEHANQMLRELDSIIKYCSTLSKESSSDQPVRISYLGATGHILSILKQYARVPIQLVEYDPFKSPFHNFETDSCDAIFNCDFSHFPSLMEEARALDVDFIRTGLHPCKLAMQSDHPLASLSSIRREDLADYEILLPASLGFDRVESIAQTMLGGTTKLSFSFAPIQQTESLAMLDLKESLYLAMSAPPWNVLGSRDDITLIDELDGKPFGFDQALGYRRNSPNPAVGEFIKNFRTCLAQDGWPLP